MAIFGPLAVSVSDSQSVFLQNHGVMIGHSRFLTGTGLRTEAAESVEPHKRNAQLRLRNKLRAFAALRLIPDDLPRLHHGSRLIDAEAVRQLLHVRRLPDHQIRPLAGLQRSHLAPDSAGVGRVDRRRAERPGLS